MRMPLAGALVGLLASLLTVTATSTALAAPAAHARADAIATIEVETPVAVPGDCDYYRVNYDMNLPAGAGGWFAELEAKSGGKGGQTSVAIANYQALSGSGFTELDLCVFSEKDLKVDLTLTGTYDDATGGTGTISAELTVKLKPAKVRAKLSVSNTAPRFNQVVRFKGRVQYYHAYLTHWYAQDVATMQLQVRARGRWAQVGESLLTAGNGTDHVDYRFNARGTFQFRLFVPAEDGHKQAVSDVVTVRTR